MASGNVVIVELQALDEVAVFDLALVLFVVWLFLWSGLLLRSCVAASTSHNTSDGLVSDFRTSSESHTLDKGTHKS